jgi:cytochrome c oxidase subunit 4
MAQAHMTAKGYVATWVVLLLLTTGTFLVSSQIHGGWEILAALLFAAAKASIVAWIFMHLSEERFASKAAFLVSILFVALLVGMVLGDVEFRPVFEVHLPESR